MTKKIILIRSMQGKGRGWMAQFVDDSEIKELFGTDTLPLPFTSESAASEVKGEVERLNPGCMVEVRRQYD